MKLLRHSWRPGAVILLLVCVPGYVHPIDTAEPARREPTVAASHQARSLHPGEVVLLSVTASAPATAVRGTAFGRDVWFARSEDPAVWRGLVGIDLNAEPGDYWVTLRVTTADDLTVESRYNLAVVSKAFDTRRLTVDPNFVNPPEEFGGRIQRESQTVGRIFRRESPEKLWSGPFRRPVPGEATSSFGRRSVMNGQPRSPHTGTDFRSGEGTPVEAPNQGRVVLAQDLYFSGNCVILDHGWGLYSYFAHLSRIAVSEGDMVSTGQIIGDVGATGRVTGPHLHWSVRLNNARVDPLALMAVLSPEPTRTRLGSGPGIPAGR